MSEVRLKIADFQHRQALTAILAENGFKVWVEVKSESPHVFGSDEYSVCFELPKEQIKP